MNVQFKLVVRTTSFIVYPQTTKALNFLNMFKSIFNTYKLVPYYHNKIRKFKRDISRNYTAGNHILNEYVFILTSINEFLAKAKEWRFRQEDFEVTYDDRTYSRHIEVESNVTFKPRKYQKKYIRALSSKKAKPCLLVDLQTGKGKTYIGTHAVKNIGKRTLVIVLPRYMKKWREDLKSNLSVTDDDIVSVRGGGELENTMQIANTKDFDPKFIIISNRTLYLFIKAYENRAVANEGFTPFDLTKVFKSSVVIIDEIHQEFFSMFKIMLYMNVTNLIALSATLESNDKDQERMYDYLFPPEARLDILKKDKYVDVVSIKYSLLTPKLRYESLMDGSYNHTELEKSIMRHKPSLDSYYALIFKLIDEYYISRIRKNSKDRLVIYAATVKMCTLLTERIAKKYKDKDVRRYVEDDPVSNILEADVSVTTIISAGTAMDIKNLITVIQTINILSIQSNKQVLGRLRKLENMKTVFVYIWAKNLKPHVRYEQARIKMLEDVTKSFTFIEYPHPVM